MVEMVSQAEVTANSPRTIVRGTTTIGGRRVIVKGTTTIGKTG